MECKNCGTPLAEQANYCNHCGARVVNERLTLKKLWESLVSDVFGWDNKYFLTLRHLLVHPEKPLGTYVAGVRKRYVNPFTFFAIGAAVAVLIYNQFTEEYLSISQSLYEEQAVIYEEEGGATANDTTAKTQQKGELTEDGKPILKEEKIRQTQAEMNYKMQKLILKYFNIFSFLMLPLYAYIAFWVYGKPYNFAEHLYINAYIQGITFLFSAIVFLLSVFISPKGYLASLPITILYYTYAYGKLYQLNLGKSLLKIGRFLVVFTVVLLIFGILSVVLGIVLGLVLKQLGYDFNG